MAGRRTAGGGPPCVTVFIRYLHSSCGLQENAELSSNLELRKRLHRPGPKRMLALDGGGIRGVLTLRVLERIEALLRRRCGRKHLVLADYFDLIGGTSTGSIIATFLALGWPVDRLRDLYHRVGREAFRPRRHWLGPVGRMLGAKFDSAPLERLLRKHLGERTLGSEDLSSGLMVIVKRADTASVWALLNLPAHAFYEDNRDLPLWEIIRASTAAPTFFSPRTIDDVGGGERAVFVDGGVSMHCNPALQLLMVARLAGFGLRWPFGEEKLLLCSVGTGSFASRSSIGALSRANNLQWATLLIGQLMADAGELNETLLQWMSKSATARVIDRQIGALGDDLLGTRPLLTYLRYDVELEKEALAAIGIELDSRAVRSLHGMSNVENVELLDRIGGALAEERVLDAHFPAAFDPWEKAK